MIAFAIFILIGVIILILYVFNEDKKKAIKDYQEYEEKEKKLEEVYEMLPQEYENYKKDYDTLFAKYKNNGITLNIPNIILLKKNANETVSLYYLARKGKVSILIEKNCLYILALESLTEYQDLKMFEAKNKDSIALIPLLELTELRYNLNELKYYKIDNRTQEETVIEKNELEMLQATKKTVEKKKLELIFNNNHNQTKKIDMEYNQQVYEYLLENVPEKDHEVYISNLKAKGKTTNEKD